MSHQALPLRVILLPRQPLGIDDRGLVFGMSNTAASPPSTAALVPVGMVSTDLSPGSRRCTCGSIRPGSTCRPRRVKQSSSAVASAPDTQRDDSAVAHADVRGFRAPWQHAGAVAKHKIVMRRHGRSSPDAMPSYHRMMRAGIPKHDGGSAVGASRANDVALAWFAVA